MQELSESTLLELWKTVKGLTQIMKKVRKGREKLCEIFICPLPTVLPAQGQSAFPVWP